MYDQYLNFVSLEEDFFITRQQNTKELSYYGEEEEGEREEWREGEKEGESEGGRGGRERGKEGGREGWDRGGKEGGRWVGREATVLSLFLLQR